MFSIQALLSAPNPDDPLSENIAKHWKTNEAEAVETGECTQSVEFCTLNTKEKNPSFTITIIYVYLYYLLLIAAKEWTRLYASGA